MSRRTVRTNTVAGHLQVLEMLRAAALAQCPDAPGNAKVTLDVDAGAYGGRTPAEDCEFTYSVEWTDVTND
jgi:hypothetical protein